MVSRELVSVGSPYPERKTISTPVVNSDSFETFIFQDDEHYRSSSVRFAQQLSIGDYSEGISQLYTTYRHVDIHTDSEKQAILQNIDSIFPPDNPYVKLQRDAAINGLNRQDPGERQLTAYYDPEVGVVFLSDIVFGDHKQLTTNTIDLLKQGKIPLIEMHTHPDDALFSNVDYQRLLLKIDDNNTRAVGALLLVCPTIQILALPSSETPCLEEDSLDLYLKKLTEQHLQQEDLRLTVLSRRYAKFFGSMPDVSTIAPRIAAEYEKIKYRLGNSDISQEEALRLASEAYTDAIRSQAKGEKLDRVLTKTKKEFNDRYNNIDNQGRIALARALHVTLYFSQNMQDFEKFSA